MKFVPWSLVLAGSWLLMSCGEGPVEGRMSRMATAQAGRGGPLDTEIEGAAGDPEPPASGLPTGPSGKLPAEGDVCAEGSAVVTRVVPKVTLVVDGSCSMSTLYPDTGAPSSIACTMLPNSRWSALRSALLDPDTGVVTRLESVVEFGLVTFGTAPSCPLPLDAVDPAPNNRAAIDAAYPAMPPGTFTPTGQALDWVFDNLLDPPPMPEDPDAMKEIRAPHIIILATDGEPNSCMSRDTDYTAPIAAAEKGAALGATMHVISLAAAGGEFYDHLRQLANIGVGEDPATGSAVPYEPGTPDQLVHDLEALIGDAIGCDLVLNGEVQDGLQCMGEVSLNGKPLPCDDPDGWALKDKSIVHLQGAACETFKSTVDATLDATFPCQVFVPE